MIFPFQTEFTYDSEGNSLNAKGKLPLLASILLTNQPIMSNIVIESLFSLILFVISHDIHIFVVCFS